MAGIFTDYWRIVKPSPSKNQYVQDNSEAAKLYSNVSWYTKIMKGAGSRFSKYNQYRNMDSDVFVARALDTIAEEMSQKNTKTNLPFAIEYQNESDTEIPETIAMTIRAALRHWSDIHSLHNKIYDIARTVIKYGDCFFRKTSDYKRWQFIEPTDVIGVSINDNGDPEHYHVRTGEKSGAFGDAQLVPAAGMIHFTLSSMMGESGPFGESVLWSSVKAWRHLTLLEDAVIIYRIVRAPERRVFNIDCGNMPPQRARAYLESIKNEMKQKRVPSELGGQDKVDSAHNPMSTNEDFFFAKSAEGRGTTVDTLPGGESTGVVADVEFFQNKFLQSLRIPSSYMRGSADGGSTITDGKVGIAYIEELRFANYVMRLQAKLNHTFDKEFKKYLASSGIKIDNYLFKIILNDPQNFQKYKQAELDDKFLSNYANIKDDETLSVRFKQKHYLGLTEDDITENEILLKQERGIPDGGIDDKMTEFRMMYDKKVIENRADIVWPEGYDDHSGKDGSEEDSNNEEGKDTEAKAEDSAVDTEDSAVDTGTDKEDSGKEEKPKEDSGKEEKPKEPESTDDIGDKIEKL